MHTEGNKSYGVHQGHLRASVSHTAGLSSQDSLCLLGLHRSFNRQWQIYAITFGAQTRKENEHVACRLVRVNLEEGAHGRVYVICLAGGGVVYGHGMLATLDIHYLSTAR